MAFPKAMTRVNRRVVNPIARRFAGRVPPFAVVVHRGRRSGREYRTPVLAFPAPEGVVIALTYGAEVDWVRNVLAAGRCVLLRRGRRVCAVEPRIVGETEGLAGMPAVIRPVLRLARVTQFLRLRPAEQPADPGGATAGAS